MDAVQRDELVEDVRARGERGTEQVLENEMIGDVCNGNNMNMKRKRSEKKTCSDVLCAGYQVTGH